MATACSSSAASVDELVATGLRPVVVAILRQELTAVERERSPVGGRSLDPARVGSRELEPIDVDHPL